MRQVVSHVCDNCVIGSKIEGNSRRLAPACTYLQQNQAGIPQCSLAGKVFSWQIHPAMRAYRFGSPKCVVWTSLHRMPFDGMEKPLKLAHGLFCLDLIIKMFVFLAKIIAFGVTAVLPNHSQGNQKKKKADSHILLVHLDIFALLISPSSLVPFLLYTPLWLLSHYSCVSSSFILAIFLFSLSPTS